MSPPSAHNPELLAVLSAAATAALGSNVRVTAIHPAELAEPSAAQPSSSAIVNHMTPGITDLITQQDNDPPSLNTDASGKATP